MSRLRIATWNTEWRRPDSSDGIEILQRLQQLDADIVCLTETHVGFLDELSGSVVDGGPLPLEVKEPSKRKVLIWSRWDWSKTDNVGNSKMKPGCLVQSESNTPVGVMTVVGVVVPYHMSNVHYGTKNRQKWEDHERYLDGLIGIASKLPDDSVVLGDYNQRLPAKWPPAPLRKKLQLALSDLDIATSGLIGPDGQRSNDHIACGRSWVCAERGTISNIASDGRELSDHFGTWIDIHARSSAV